VPNDNDSTIFRSYRSHTYTAIHAQACWKLAIVVKDDLTCKLPKVQFSVSRKRHPKCLDRFHIFPCFIPTSSAVPIFYFHPPEDRLRSEMFDVVSPLYVNRKSRYLHQWIAFVSLVSTRCYMPRYSLKTRPAHAY